MQSLLKLIDSYYCTKGEAESAADWAAFGMFMVEADCGRYAVGKVQEFVAAKHALLRTKDSKPVTAPSTVRILGTTYQNDAFVGHLWNEDGLQRVTFPGYGLRVSSSALAEDWRYLILALASGANPEQPAILEVVYGDGTVRGHVSPEAWEAVDDIHGRLSTTARKETPGDLCVRCVWRHTCESLTRFQDTYDLPALDSPDKKQAAHRLWLVALSLRSRLKALDENWKQTSKRLKALIEQGRVNINDYFYLDATTTERSSYPFGATHALLSTVGLWKSEYGKIQVGELHKDSKTFPKNIQERLERLKQVDTGEPSLREVVQNGQHSIKSAPLLVGISRKK